MTARVATVGTFDGLHRGHRAIIDKLKHIAAETGLTTALITFKAHPLSTIAPQRCPATVMGRDEVESSLKTLGIEDVEMLDFTASLASLTARQFLAMLRQRFDVHHLVMGFDNTFGSDRLTLHDDYTAAARAEGIDITFVDPVLTADGRKISSSLLRHALRDGDTPLARECTGTWPRLTGKVVHGKENGRKLGFPTMNISPHHSLPLRRGAYIATMNYGGHTYHGVLNVGHNPTFGDENSLTYEFHVPDIDLGDMYGKTITIDILKFLREEKKFASLDELSAAIKANINEMKNYFTDSNI